jgi:hypothetical protein
MCPYSKLLRWVPSPRLEVHMRLVEAQSNYKSTRVTSVREPDVKAQPNMG